MSRKKSHTRAVRKALKANQADQARRELEGLCVTAEEAGAGEAARLAALLRDLLEMVECFGGSEKELAKAADVTTFVADTLPALDDAFNEQDNAGLLAADVVEIARSEWGEYLDLLPGTSAADDGWGNEWAETTPADESNTDEFNPADVDLAGLLAGLETPAAANPAPPERKSVKSPKANVKQSTSAPALPAPPPPEQPEIDAEILEAYSDDAGNCLASMEQCLLTIESDPTNADAMRQFCRELHTLKGASGSVGLSALAGYLHQLEDHIEATHTSGGALDVDPVLGAVDVVRGQMAVLCGGQVPTPDVAATPAATISEKPISSPAAATPAATGDAETSFVRVEASRLGKLLDLLAELVSLRNRRDSYVSGLRNFHSGITGCVARMRTLTERLSDGGSEFGDDSEGVTRSASRHATYRARELAELCSDVAELNRSLRDVFDPLGDDNLAVSRLIGEFRRELMDLQRVPVAGLFRRLHRGTRDAARMESKRVEVDFVGDDVRLERSLQERLYEPLLHIVRNAVSHGIEDADGRETSGKAAAGRVTLTAQSNATSLVFEVRDDGKGLDYERLEQKGRERGLIPVGHSPSHDRLARLIFHPGFSTRNEVSEVSGRGVGMDVVATQVHRMRGRVEIDSETGRGTSIRLQIPLRSSIEHAMVIRCGGQLFAIPMQFVQAARPEIDDLPDGIPTRQLNQLLGLPEESGEDRPLVVIGRQGTGGDDGSRRLAIEVDGVVGAEEVVVRAMPSLLSGHPLFSGLTLSGHGETVLLLDVGRLIDFASSSSQQVFRRIEQTATEGGTDKPKVLIVDDSLSTRRTHVRMAQAAGYDTEEASDGLEALKLLKTGGFRAVLTDLEMPRLGGFELVSEIKQRSRIRDLPVIVITSRGDEESHRRLYGIGADAVVIKPLTNVVFDDLRRTLENKSEANTEQPETAIASS